MSWTLEISTFLKKDFCDLAILDWMCDKASRCLQFSNIAKMQSVDESLPHLVHIGWFCFFLNLQLKVKTNENKDDLHNKTLTQIFQFFLRFFYFLISCNCLVLYNHQISNWDYHSNNILLFYLTLKNLGRKTKLD